MKAETRMRAIEDRLAKLEKTLNVVRPAQPLPPAQPAVPVPALQSALPPRPAVLPVAPPMQAQARTKSRPANWLGVVAVICFVLAAGFIIKLSLESGWLTPERQIGLAAMFGLSLIAVGLSLLTSDREYAGYLPAAGIIVLYASVFAAHRLYSLIPFETAISMTALVSALCIWLYTQIRDDLYPVTAAVGSYVGPLLLGLDYKSVFTVYYYLFCSIGFSVISIWVRSRILTIVAAYLSIMMTALTGLALRQDGLIVTMLALNFVIFTGGTFLYTAHHETPLNENESMSFLPVLMFFYAMEYYFIERIHPGLAPWISLGFAGVLLGIYLAAKQRFPDGKVASGSMILAFVTVVCFHSFYLELLPSEARPWLFVALVFGLCFPSGTLSGRTRDKSMRIPTFGVLAVLLLEYLSMASKLLSTDSSSTLFVAVFSVAALWALIYFREEEWSGRGEYTPLLGSAHLLAILALYKLTRDSGSLEVSISWLVYAVAVMAFAFSRRDEAMARSAVFVLAFAAGKALLYDAAAAPTIVRIVCLLLTGAALYGAGFFLRKISGWKTGAPTQP
ncbi:MAG TPA: DUF2339 domain-containing protein [Elusimicrobia bacterium]|nr:DUF2339 domain-containing protein [Elusimicrobiota bacterium]